MTDYTGTEWDGLMSKIPKECGDDHGIELEIEVLIHKLRQALERKSNLFWQVNFLEQYIKEDLNPQGLRIQVFLIFWDIKKLFKKKCEASLQECTAKMMISPTSRLPLTTGTGMFTRANRE